MSLNKSDVALIQEVFLFRQKILDNTKKGSPERQLFSNILYGYYDDLPDKIETAKIDLEFLRK